MRITPGTNFKLDTLRGLEVFHGLSEEQLEWIRANSERMDVATDEIITRAGDPVDWMYVLVSGTFQWRFGVQGQTTLFTETRPGTVGGALPFSRATKSGGEARAVSDAVGMRLHKDKFPEMLQRIPELTQRLVSIMSDRVKRATQFIDQREKMSALGKMAAGLAHELNNPASALKRSASELLERMNGIQKIAPELMVRDIGREDVAAAIEFRQRMMQRTQGDSMTSVARAEREDEISDWLEQTGVPEPWVVAEQLVTMGATLDDLEEFSARSKVDAGTLPLALQWIAGSATAQMLVREILSAADRISQLVASIKVHAHMDRNSDKQEIDVREGLESTLTILNHKLRKKAITVKREFTETLPRVPAYPGEMNQVWTNLIDNAIDAMDEGGTLTIKTCKEGQCICVRVCDTGHGIPEDIQKRIFEPFFTTKGMGEGTGLGLDIVQRIVTQQHGGDIRVESKPGNTCFTVWLPLAAR